MGSIPATAWSVAPTFAPKPEPSAAESLPPIALDKPGVKVAGLELPLLGNTDTLVQRTRHAVGSGVQGLQRTLSQHNPLSDAGRQRIKQDAQGTAQRVGDAGANFTGQVARGVLNIPKDVVQGLAHTGKDLLWDKPRSAGYQVRDLAVAATTRDPFEQREALRRFDERSQPGTAIKRGQEPPRMYANEPVPQAPRLSFDGVAAMFVGPSAIEAAKQGDYVEAAISGAGHLLLLRGSKTAPTATTSQGNRQLGAVPQAKAAAGAKTNPVQALGQAVRQHRDGSIGDGQLNAAMAAANKAYAQQKGATVASWSKEIKQQYVRHSADAQQAVGGAGATASSSPSRTQSGDARPPTLRALDAVGEMLPQQLRDDPLAVPRTRAQYSGAALPLELVRAGLARSLPGLDVNPLQLEDNCLDTAMALDRRRASRPPPPVIDLNKDEEALYQLYGRLPEQGYSAQVDGHYLLPEGEPFDVYSLQRYIAGLPEGGRGIVLMHYPLFEPGHALLAEKINGRVYFLDGQSGAVVEPKALSSGAIAWPGLLDFMDPSTLPDFPDAHFKFLRTDDIATLGMLPPDVQMGILIDVDEQGRRVLVADTRSRVERWIDVAAEDIPQAGWRLGENVDVIETEQDDGTQHTTVRSQSQSRIKGVK